MSGEKKQKTKILLADGHYIVRKGIRRIFEAEPDMEVVGDADNGEQVSLSKSGGGDAACPIILIHEMTHCVLDYFGTWH